MSPMPNMMTPNMGLMAQVSIQENDAGTRSANAATSSTMTPIQRAMKSHNCFNDRLLGFFLEHLVHAVQIVGRRDAEGELEGVEECGCIPETTLAGHIFQGKA